MQWKSLEIKRLLPSQVEANFVGSIGPSRDDPLFSSI